jgi:muramoyltetrapeptide carboxypeptidase
LNALSLKPGDGVGLIAPAGNVAEKDIQEGIEILDRKGFNLKFADHLLGKHRYFAGTITERLEDIHQFLEDPDIKALYAVRGGMGSAQLLPELNYGLWKRTKKLLIGFSDITALQWAIFGKIGLSSFSGMTLTLHLKNYNPYLELFFQHIQGQKKSIKEEDLIEDELVIGREGEAEGILLGGNLAMINSILGTPFFPSLNPFVLFVEDLNEPMYRIERALYQLKLAGVLDRLVGVILGRFFSGEQLLELWPTLAYIFPQNIPVVLNFPYGHYLRSCALPLGLSVKFSTNPFMLNWE